MELKDTIEMMQSTDYKERFKAEYQQTKIRYDKLHKMLTKAEAGTLDFTPTCPLELLREQKANMGRYLHCLEIRAEIEKIDLSFNGAEGEKHTEFPLGVIENPKAKDHGYMGGYYYRIEGKPSDELLEIFKEKVVKKICDQISDVAEKCEDFFIIKEYEGGKTVGAKFVLPTVKADYGI
ncbi:MAG: hypothetical protein U0M06_02115 [Clostridia bacterium]|nr:hypothetical protein [Clostridia bacterium]